MALTNNGTAVTVKDAPVGFTPPVVTRFADFQWKFIMTVTTLKSAVDDPDALTTFNALVADVTAAVDAKLADFEAVVNDVDAFSDFRVTNINTGPKFTDAPENYINTVDVFVKTTL